jgi:hypothetical protein
MLFLWETNLLKTGFAVLFHLRNLKISLRRKELFYTEEMFEYTVTSATN